MDFFRTKTVTLHDFRGATTTSYKNNKGAIRMDMNEEVRRGYTISKEMKKVWAVQLDLAKKLLEVCDKHGLRITASGGTTLGAVREHGFIPWDDDIDFQMLREDYDQLAKIAPQEFKSPYFFQTTYTDKSYVRGHAQLRMDNTSAVLFFDVFRPFHQGIFIDIFPLDAVPSTDEGINRLRLQSEKALKKLRDITCPVIHLLNKDTYKWHEAARILLAKPFVSLRKAYAEYENLFRAVDVKEAEEVAMMTFTWDLFEKTRCTKHVMDNIIKVPFEDIMMPIPAIYDEVLRRQYGDYMTPSKAPSYHGWAIVALDADRSYQDVLREERKRRMSLHKQQLLKALHLKK